jgi:transcriptional regulator with XRE-family HTH domain
MPKKTKQLAKKSAAPQFDVEFATARKRAGLTAVALHELTGISRPTLIAYEAGHTSPSVRNIWLLCKSLHVTPNKLIFGTEYPFGVSGPELPKPKKAKSKKALTKRTKRLPVARRARHSKAFARG